MPAEGRGRHDFPLLGQVTGLGRVGTNPKFGDLALDRRRGEGAEVLDHLLALPRFCVNILPHLSCLLVTLLRHLKGHCRQCLIGRRQIGILHQLNDLALATKISGTWLTFE